MKIIPAAVLSGLITGFISFSVGSALWFAPWAMKLSKKYSSLPIWKNLPVPVFLPVVFAWGMIFTIVLAVIFVHVRQVIPGNIYVQGLIFGAVIWFLKNLTEFINAFVLINKPLDYLLLELFYSFIGLLLTGVLLSAFLKVFTK